MNATTITNKFQELMGDIDKLACKIDKQKVVDSLMNAQDQIVKAFGLHVMPIFNGNSKRSVTVKYEFLPKENRNIVITRTTCLNHDDPDDAHTKILGELYRGDCGRYGFNSQYPMLSERDLGVVLSKLHEVNQ